MVTEQDKTLKALHIATQMEIDGKEFYLKASEKSGNEMGQKLLKSLAAEEDIHRQKFEKIYNAIRDKQAWPATDSQPDGTQGLKTVFSMATKDIANTVKPSGSELEDIQTAMDMENKTYDFYKIQSGQASYDAEKDFYESVAAQERVHHALLYDYYEYLQDPAGWFVKKEHPSLDGC